MTYDFTSDLTVGSTGASVTSLQQLLISKGYLKHRRPDGLLRRSHTESSWSLPGGERDFPRSRILWS